MSAKPAIFHEGEIAIQKRLGVDEKMDRFGRMVIRDFMPEQHQQFYQSLPMLFVGHVDANDDVWASVLASDPGFVKAPDARALTIQQMPFKGDPLLQTLGTESGSETIPTRLGLLGIELASRRRNRMSAQVANVSEKGIALDVVQTFGNCPQYIQTRELTQVQRDPRQQTVERIEVFDTALTQFISQADTFFVASSTQRKGGELDATEGADVSHRGGQSGFIKVQDNKTLLIPDYTGNNHYNTLGNILVNPHVGLLFIDFDSGDLHTLTGEAEILWDDPAQEDFSGAERLWRFTLKHGYVLKAAMPYEFTFKEWSPNSLMTGTWREAEAKKMLREMGKGWNSWKISKVEDESASIRSFYFSTEEYVVPDFKPGQFIAVKVTIDGKRYSRNYSVSSAPQDPFFRISVKRDGVVSNWLHDNIQAGDDLEIKLPSGIFFLDDTSEKTAVLLSAGVGITPMLSMYRYIINEAVRTRSPRPVIMVNTFRNETEQAFLEEVSDLTRQANQFSSAVWLLTQPGENAEKGVNYSAQGRITKDIIQQILPLGRYDFYLCGPGTFMQDIYDTLLSLGVADEDIKAESFGPAALRRQRNRPAKAEAKPITVKKAAPTSAKQAVVTFTKSQVEQAWSEGDGTILEFAEKHGMSPEFGCRSGSCGSCKVNLVKGNVVYDTPPDAPLEEGEVLLCCAKPAKGSEESVSISVDA